MLASTLAENDSPNQALYPVLVVIMHVIERDRRPQKVAFGPANKLHYFSVVFHLEVAVFDEQVQDISTHAK